MNKETALQKIQEILGSGRFVIHPDLIKDIMKTIKNSGKESRVFTTLIARLEFLAEHKQEASIHKEFEPIGDGFYSMHIAVSDTNLRIIYAFQDPETVLLLAFFERAGKRKTDYTGKKQIAQQRMKQLYF